MTTKIDYIRALISFESQKYPTDVVQDVLREFAGTGSYMEVGLADDDWVFAELTHRAPLGEAMMLLQRRFDDALEIVLARKKKSLVRLVICVEGGVVTNVISEDDRAIHAVIADFDTEGRTDDEILTLTNGDEYTSQLEYATKHTELVNEVFNSLK